MIPPRPRQANRGPLLDPGPTGRRRFFTWRTVRAPFSQLVGICRFMLLPWLLARWHGRALLHQSGAAGPLAPSEPVAVVPWYGNAAMLAAFLAHHRGLGVSEYVLLDLSPQGDLAQRLGDEARCAVWRPRDAPDPAKAVFWLNDLRRRYGSGRWVLSLEPCDMLVFHRCETRQISDLIDFLVSERRNHAYGLIVEVYGEAAAMNLQLQPGEHPLNKLPYFDPFGYATLDPGPDRDVIVRGGVQRRAAFADAPRRSPALNRIPLVRWQRFHTYVAGTRLAMPRRLNTPHAAWHTSPTVCLLRCVLLDDDASLAASSQVEAHEAAGDDDGSRSLSRVGALREVPLKIDCSVRYRSSEDLVACGLLNPGQWF